MNNEEINRYLEYVDTFGIVPGLFNMNCLVNELYNPLENIKVIHVAGTNGKGSVSTMIAYMLTALGKKVGIYNSPALVNPYEVIRFGNDDGFRENRVGLSYITENDYYRSLDKVICVSKKLNEKDIYPTRFELETATAFVAIKDKECEYAIIETGMGGSEDATNVISNPVVTVLTAISMDHMSYLGNTIEEITKCKCGIIKENSEVVVSASNKVCFQGKVAVAIEEEVNAKNAKVVYSDENQLKINETDIYHIGCDYKELDDIVINCGALCQLENVMTAIDVINSLEKQGYLNIDKECLRKGLEAFAWKGRFEIVKSQPLVIADGAHNIAAANVLKDTIISAGLKDKIILLMAVYKDKDYEEILKIMSHVSTHIICTDVGNARALEAKKLAAVAKDMFEITEWEENIEKAIVYGEKQASDRNKALLCFGTLAMMKFFK